MCGGGACKFCYYRTTDGGPPGLPPSFPPSAIRTANFFVGRSRFKSFQKICPKGKFFEMVPWGGPPQWGGLGVRSPPQEIPWGGLGRRSPPQESPLPVPCPRGGLGGRSPPSLTAGGRVWGGGSPPQSVRRRFDRFDNSFGSIDNCPAYLGGLLWSIDL